MGRLALPCVICSKPLINVDGAVDNQPYGGTEFTTTGHYGSTIHDEIGRPVSLELVVNICDTCILRAVDAAVIQSRSVDFEIVLANHHIPERARAWVLAQNEKQYGSAWGADEPVDYVAKMRESGWTLPLDDDPET